MRSAVIGGLLVLSPACADKGADEPMAMLPGLCDEDGPHRVLPLEELELVDQIVPLEDRLLYQVTAYPSSPPLSERPDPLSTRIDTAGRCGEDPRTVAGGLKFIDADHGIVLACDEELGRVFAVDPNGAEPPALVTSPGSCVAAPTEFGVVAVTWDGVNAWGDLVIDRTPRAEPTDEEVLASDIAVDGPLWGDGRRTLVLSRDGDIIDVDLASGESTIVVSPASDFRVDSAGERIVWEEGEPAPDGGPTEASMLHHRLLSQDGDDALTVADLTWSPFPFASDHIVLRTDGTGGERIYALPDLVERKLPGGSVFRGFSPDRQIWLGEPGDWRAIRERLWNPATDRYTLLYEGPGYPARRDDGLEVFVPAEGGSLQSGSVQFVPWSGTQLVTLADGVHFDRVSLPDGRVLSVEPDEATLHGPLTLHGEDERTAIADEVYLKAPALNRTRPFEGDIVYTVSDGDDSGVWRARLP